MNLSSTYFACPLLKAAPELGIVLVMNRFVLNSNILHSFNHQIINFYHLIDPPCGRKL
jgi:hypothetical protein